jgi:purine-binding chemotaxis protein CheW
VINLRGNVVPVVDMRVILGLPKVEISAESCIIIIEISIADETVVVGALADSVQRVEDIPDSAIGPAPKIGTKLKIEFLTGIGKIQGKFVMILNMDRVLSLEELDLMEKLTTMAEGPPIDDGEPVAEETQLEP